MLEARVEPRRIGRYTLVAKLASGGMATVYLAQAHGELGFARLCAVKIIHPHLLDQPEFLARFLHEGKVASGIRHPNVVSVLDVGQDGETPYLVLDYVRGASLAELLKRAEEASEPPSVEVACTIVREALEGLHAVHTAQDEHGVPLGLIHRDVSHDNLLLSTDGVAYVTDLGIARARGIALTRATGLLGKAGYISPEQLAKEPLTPKVDLFAAGVVLWELLTQKRLFPDLESELPMLTGTFVLEPPSASNPMVPAGLDNFVARMLARNPDDRPRSAGAAAQELARIVGSAPRSEIAEWVQALAEAKLERLDALLRDAKASVPPPPMDGGAWRMNTPGRAVTSPQGGSGPIGGAVGSGPVAVGVRASYESGDHARVAGTSAPARSGRWGLGVLGAIVIAAGGGATAWRAGVVGPARAQANAPANAHASATPAASASASASATASATPSASASASASVTAAPVEIASAKPRVAPPTRGRPAPTKAAAAAKAATPTAPTPTAAPTPTTPVVGPASERL